MPGRPALSRLPVAVLPVIALATAGLAATVAADATTPPGGSTLLTAYALRSGSWEPSPEPRLDPADDPELRAARSQARRVPAAPVTAALPATEPDPAPAGEPAPAPAPAAPATPKPPAQPTPAAQPKPTAPAPAKPSPSPARPPNPPAAPARPATPAPASAPAFSVSTARTGAAVENGLTSNAMKVLNAVRAAYPGLSFGGRRAGSDDHGTGQALDIMVPNATVGDAVAAFVQSHSGALSVDYVIWRQRIWNAAGGGWRSMADRGSPTANHMDHVHVSVR